MTLFNFLQQTLIVTEGLTALVGLWYYNQLKDTYWKYFVAYCVIIFLQELFSEFVLDAFPEERKHYFDIIGIPIQFLFLFWLFAQKSLQSNKLYWGSTTVYLCILIRHFFYISETRLVNELSYTVGCLLLFSMSVLEFNQQIKSDDIIHFKNNKMFYINIGVVLFYVGSMPFFTFDVSFYNIDIEFWRNYRLFFLITDIIMYLLFTASFIWGKTRTS